MREYKRYSVKSVKSLGDVKDSTHYFEYWHLDRKAKKAPFLEPFATSIDDVILQTKFLLICRQFELSDSQQTLIPWLWSVSYRLRPLAYGYGIHLSL
jgi:hypothetical protein